MRGGRRQREQQHSSAVSATKQRGGTSDTHARQQRRGALASPPLCWTILSLSVFVPALRFILLPDEKQEFSHPLEEQKPRDATHKARSPESFAALPLMRAAHAHPLHCSALSPAPLTPGCQPLLQGSARKADRVFVGGEQVDVEGGWRAGADGGVGGGWGWGEVRASRGWEPTSPWSKDRPPVPLKNTCEFDLTFMPALCSEV